MATPRLAPRPGRRQAALLLLAGTLIGIILLTPAGAHIGDSVSHLWSDHIRPKGDLRYESDKDVLFATVSANGTLGSNDGATSVTKFGSAGDGDYAVIFNRNVSQCAPVATIADTVGGSGEITAEPYSQDVKGVFITTRNPNGSASDNDFNLVVVCN
jgi:hypothetical protein